MHNSHGRSKSSSFLHYLWGMNILFYVSILWAQFSQGIQLEVPHHSHLHPLSIPWSFSDIQKYEKLQTCGVWELWPASLGWQAVLITMGKPMDVLLITPTVWDDRNGLIPWEGTFPLPSFHPPCRSPLHTTFATRSHPWDCSAATTPQHQTREARGTTPTGTSWPLTAPMAPMTFH